MHRITLKNSLLKNNYNLFYYMYKNNKNKIEKLCFFFFFLCGKSG